VSALIASVREATDRFTSTHPGGSSARQPVHTVYGGAHLFRADVAAKFGTHALRFMDEHVPDPGSFADAFDLSGELADGLYGRVREKLAREPIEDFRIDFEDGYGLRSDEDEDQCAIAAAREVARGMAEASLPPFLGIRVKALSGGTARRAVRTLDLFLGELFARSGGTLPENFVVTLPKVVVHEQVAAFADLLEQLEGSLGLEQGKLEIELMVETPQAIIGADGRCPLWSFVQAARGRCRGAHFGVYDYTASLSITAAQQLMRHPACDFARQVMQAALAGSGIMLSDGATNVIPVLPRERVLAAWRLHFGDVRHSLANGFYQGWDLHPTHLPSRYAAVFAFFRDGLEQATERLRSFIERAAQASLVGEMFDDAATGQGLLNYFLRAVNCGAISEDEASATGLRVEELRLRSFAAIVAGRV